MIHLKRINHMPLVLNADLIEHIETTPDTVISLTTGRKLVVEETVAEVVRRVIEYRQAIGCARPVPGERTAGPEVPAGPLGREPGEE